MLSAFSPGIPELVIILVIVMLLFGAKKLPEMAKSLGQASKEFKKGVADADASPDDDDAPAKPKKSTDTASDEKD